MKPDNIQDIDKEIHETLHETSHILTLLANKYQNPILRHLMFLTLQKFTTDALENIEKDIPPTFIQIHKQIIQETIITLIETKPKEEE